MELDKDNPGLYASMIQPINISVNLGRENLNELGRLGAYNRGTTFPAQVEVDIPIIPITFQMRVRQWAEACFGQEIADDKVERNHRFVEESLELAQANGISKEECLQLVEYVYNRPVGEQEQEVGGVMTTLAALCAAYGISMDECGERELKRVWEKIDKIRAKQKAKPKYSPLPE